MYLVNKHLPIVKFQNPRPPQPPTAGTPRRHPSRAVTDASGILGPQKTRFCRFGVGDGGLKFRSSQHVSAVPVLTAVVEPLFSLGTQRGVVVDASCDIIRSCDNLPTVVQVSLYKKLCHLLFKTPTCRLRRKIIHLCVFHKLDCVIRKIFICEYHPTT